MKYVIALVYPNRTRYVQAYGRTQREFIDSCRPVHLAYKFESLAGAITVLSMFVVPYVNRLNEERKEIHSAVGTVIPCIYGYVESTGNLIPV
jgi:hypothetical protein